MNYWLIKSEPESYSIDDLARDKKTNWDGVRNYQARNFIRAMKKGDGVLFYHSSVIPSGVVGVGKIGGSASADLSAQDKKSHYYDPKATKEKPIWDTIEVIFVKKLKRMVTLSEIKEHPGLWGIKVAEQGSRLSVQPLSEAHFNTIISLGSQAV